MNLNATLLHEIRMIVRQLFPLGAGGASSLFGRNESSSGLRCVVCLREKRIRPKLAITVAIGNALCADHVI